MSSRQEKMPFRTWNVATHCQHLFELSVSDLVSSTVLRLLEQPGRQAQTPFSYYPLKCERSSRKQEIRNRKFANKRKTALSTC
jgi:hypothetical protein